MSLLGSALEVEASILELTLIILTTYHCYEFIKYTTKIRFSIFKSFFKIIEILMPTIPPRTQLSEKKQETKNHSKINQGPRQK